MSDPTIEIRYQFFPTAWDDGISRRMFELLVGSDRVFPATRWSNEGKKRLPSENVIDWLTDWYEGSFKGNRIPLFTDYNCDQFRFDLLRSEWGDHSKVGQLLFWPKNLVLVAPVARAATAESLDAMTEVAAITDAPLVPIDYRSSPKFKTITLESRHEMKRVVQGTVHGNAMAGPWRGLHRIPWRLILGRHIVQTIGKERLSQLPTDRAIDHGNGLWTLQTSPDPAQSIEIAGREAEREIMEILGTEYFANTQLNKLAEVKPNFPPELVPDDARLRTRFGDRLKPL